MIGRVKKLKNNGYGFIVTEPDMTEYFFHVSQYKGDWDELLIMCKSNEPLVVFESQRHARGPRALGVELIEE